MTNTHPSTILTSTALHVALLVATSVCFFRLCTTAMTSDRPTIPISACSRRHMPQTPSIFSIITQCPHRRNFHEQSGRFHPCVYQPRRIGMGAQGSAPKEFRQCKQCSTRDDTVVYSFSNTAALLRCLAERLRICLVLFPLQCGDCSEKKIFKAILWSSESQILSMDD